MSSYFSVRRLTRGERVGVLRQLLASARSRRMAAAALVWFGLAAAAQAQESIRMSLASEEAAEARRRAVTTAGYYNLQLGPTRWNFGADLALSYNDNITYRAQNPESDFITRPEVTSRMFWPVSDLNSLNLSMGAGYAIYANHSDFSRFFISPGSELSFDLYVGDAWINFHDRFSIIDTLYQDPTFAGTADYQRLENVIGATSTWDLNKIILKFGYDHVDEVDLSDNLPVKDEQVEVFSTSAGINLKPGLRTGLELGGELIQFTPRFRNAPYTSAKQWNVGPFVETQLTEYLRFRASAGYTMFQPDGSGPLAESTDSFYTQAGLTHRLNQYVTYTLSGGRSISFSYYGGNVDMYYAILSANWNLVQKLQLGTAFSYYTGSQGFTSTDDFDWYGPTISLSRQLTEKLTGSLAYRYYKRTSNLAGGDYSVSVVGLNMEYRF